MAGRSRKIIDISSGKIGKEKIKTVRGIGYILKI